MRRTTILIALAVAASGCVTGDGSATVPAGEPEVAVVDPPALELAVLERCEVENGVYRLAVERLSDGSVACEAEPLDDPAPTYAGEACAGPDPCECSAGHGERAWDFYWPAGAPPRVECYVLGEPWWQPCGCGTRLSFDEGDCS